MNANLFLIETANELEATYESTVSAGMTAWISLSLILLFSLGVLQSIRTYLRARHTIRHQIDSPKPTLQQVQDLAMQRKRPLPFMVILVPARDEAAVIANTIKRLTQLDYPTQHYAVVIITDKREKSKDGAPTTRDIADTLAEELNSGLDAPWLYVVNVPAWYSGHFGCAEKRFSRSTKGRALNYALQYLRNHQRMSRTDMLGILDADGRMHPKALLEVACKRLRDDAKVLQGPVFQVSNYPNVSLAGKAAGIELSIYHLSTLAYRLQRSKRTAEFLAGTNYFIDLAVMIELGGWNERALVEDAELGLRLFLQKGIKPGWLSCYEIEQTPPDYKVYLQQRQRWALGHFQLLPTIYATALPLMTKIRLSGRVLSAILKSPIDIGLPVLGWIALFFGWTQGLAQWLDWIMLSLFIGSIFVWDFFGRGFLLLDKFTPGKELSWGQRRIQQLRFILAMPWLILLQAQPRLVALYKYLTGSDNDAWVKTRRTVEESAEVVQLPVHKNLKRDIPVVSKQKLSEKV